MRGLFYKGLIAIAYLLLSAWAVKHLLLPLLAEQPAWVRYGSWLIILLPFLGLASIGLTGNTLRPRVLELIRRGMLIETAEMRRTASGCNAHVLIAREPNPTDR